MPRDYYETLGVASSATPDELKKAYRRLAKQYHPDVNTGNKAAEDKFKEISEAYSVLSEPEKRKQYDMLRRYGGGFPPGAGPSPGAGSSTDSGRAGWSGGEEFEFPGFEGMGDLFGELFNMGGMRGRARGGANAGNAGQGRWQTYGPEDFGGVRRGRPEKGHDLRATVEIEFLEAIHGTRREVNIEREGRSERIAVKIPAGVDNGSVVRVAGKGDPQGRTPGDLLLNIRVRPHPKFWREGADLYTEVPITIYESILGARIDVPTIDGMAKMTIPPGTASDQKFRLKEKGTTQLGKKGTGDLYVIVQIVPPQSIDEITRHLAEELAKQAPYNPREK